MPYITFNGQLFQITQAQYDSYTIGDPLPSGAVFTNPSNVAAGGTVTENNSTTTPILTPNTTNNTPGQPLTTTAAITVDSSAAPTNFGTTIQTFDDGTTLQTFDDGSVLATSTSGSVTSSPAPTEDPQAIARAGLTADQLTLLGAADATDPFIRARLDLPPLSDVQTLSGAIGNVNFGNVGNAVGNIVTSFGNVVGNINFGDIGNTVGNVASSFGNAIGNIGDYFSGNTSTTVSDSQVANTESTTVSTSTADAGSGTTVGTTTDVVPDSQVETAPAEVNPAVDPEAQAPVEPVPASQVEIAPAPIDAGEVAVVDIPPTEVVTTAGSIDSAVDPQASLAPGETIVPTDQVSTDAPVDNTQGYGQITDANNVTADTIAQAPSAYTADELNAIADAQGVAGEEGNITADTLARDPGSYTADELNAIADAQGVAGEEGNITADSLAKDPGSYTAAELDAIAEAQGVGAGDGPIDPTNTGTGTSADGDAASANIQGLVKNAQNQNTIASQRKQINNGDWRVRLRLAPQADYLYKAKPAGILQPLAVTDGIIFPYTPAISTSYRANYSNYDLTHSNYRGYFYQNSYVDAVNLTATFTAQDTNDANYLLAVIHFLRSVTKMFYGQDAKRGSPPPVVYLTGLGDYQFREHSCLISQFTYNLPADVDYIRAGSPNNAGLNFNNIRDRQSVATNSIFGSVNRLAAAFLPPGGITSAKAPPTLGLNRPTYVPTKMEIQLTLLPIQSRQQVSKQFSVKEFANGNLLKGGFW